MSLLSQVRAQHERLSVDSGSKAISHRPDLAGRTHVLQQYSDAVAMELDSYADYAKVYKVYVWVRKAVSKIADSISSLPVVVTDAAGDTLSSHRVSELLANVNDTMSPPDLWQRWVVHKMLAGESFFEIVTDGRGQPVELWPRAPDKVKVLPDVSKERELFPRVAGYIYGDTEKPISAGLMWHSRFYNPVNPWRGLAPIAAVREGIIIDLFAQSWSKAFLKSGARPDYAVIAPQGITRTEKDDLETQLALKFGGQENWHKPIVLEEGITDIKTFSFAPKDIEWLEQRKFARDEVGGVFGVPDEVMGYGRDTYENMDAAHRWFWLLTLLPLIKHRDSSLTHFFTKLNPQLQPGERITTDLSSIGVLQEDIKPKLEQARSFWEMGVPLNMINEKLGLGLGSVPGGDVGYLPVNLLPVSVEASPAAGAQSWRGVTITGQRTPPRSKSSVPVYGSAIHKALWNRHVAKTKPHERAMQRQLKRQFQRQQNEVLRALRSGKSAKVVMDNPSVEDLFNLRVENIAIAEGFETLLLAMYTEFAEEQLNELAGGVGFNQNQAVLDYINQHAAELAKNINETTRNGIRAVLAEAQDEGLSMAEIQDKLNELFAGRKSNYETERIARTEMNRASNEGIIEGLRQSGVVEKKAWLAALDIRTRDSHVAAHLRYQEEPISLEALFEVGGGAGPAPGQIGVAAEDINCRCVVLAVLD